MLNRGEGQQGHLPALRQQTGPSIHPRDCPSPHLRLTGVGMGRCCKLVCSRVPPVRRHDAERDRPRLAFGVNCNASHRQEVVNEPVIAVAAAWRPVPQPVYTSNHLDMPVEELGVAGGATKCLPRWGVHITFSRSQRGSCGARKKRVRGAVSQRANGRRSSRRRPGRIAWAPSSCLGRSFLFGGGRS
jgi:hypothetical protein